MENQERIIEKIKKIIKDFTRITFAIIPATVIMLVLSKILEVINPQFHSIDIRIFVELMIISFTLSVGVILGLQMALKEIGKKELE